MKRAKSWVLTVAMTCFGAGIAVGLVVPDVVEAVSAEESQDADEEFILRWRQEYDLTPEQVEMLRMILTDREEEEMRHISSFGFLKLPQDLRTRLTRVRTKADERIKVMLNESQRMQYQEELEKKKGDPWPRP